LMNPAIHAVDVIRVSGASETAATNERITL
jgi:hypothetical protein